MMDWANLKDVGGRAKHIPELLEELEKSRDREVLFELWDRLCHQGSVYSASFAALPELIRIAKQWYPSDDSLQLIHLATSILTGEDGDNLRRPHIPIEGEEIPTWTTTSDRIDLDSPTREGYQTEIDALLCLSEKYLQQPNLSENDFVGILSSIVALKGYSLWAELLEYFALSWSGWGGNCHCCEAYICIHTTEESAIAEVETIGLETKQTFIHRALPESLVGVAQWLYKITCDRRFDVIAQKITYMFGRGNCPQCGADFQVPEIMKFTELQ